MHSKVFDGILVDEITSYFERSGFFVEEQFGFRKQYNCEMALLVENIRLVLEAGGL